MGCPTECEIGDNLVFSVTTHDPDTGILTDADAVPVYWIYEDETGVSMNASTPLSDNMAKLDDAHTTGLYSELIAVTALNGYENGKTYTVYIEATVDGDKGGISYSFKAYDRRKADAVAISTSTTAADNLEASAKTIVVGEAAAGTLSTTQMTTTLTEATNDHYNGRIIIWTSGALINQATDITDYDGASKLLTFTAVTEAPGEGNTFVIV
jgi:hypothetical protein